MLAIPALAALCGGCLFAGNDSAPADVVMSPCGDVKTITAALEKVRAMRASGAIPAGRAAEVCVEPGRYAVTEIAVFTPADSNVRFTAAKKGRAVFDGGVALPPFKPGADGIWRASVPDGLDFEQPQAPQLRRYIRLLLQGSYIWLLPDMLPPLQLYRIRRLPEGS